MNPTWFIGTLFILSLDTSCEFAYSIAVKDEFIMTPQKEKPEQPLEKIAKTIPVLPVISDNPLDVETAFPDRFDLSYRLGPVFDIIRHPDTKLPTTIAIYGDWGKGKTTAMRWLQAAIDEWNKAGPKTWKQGDQTKKKTKINHVWFYPWKYHDKEDVWRGLIAEVILKGIDIKGATVARITKAAKQFGLFLGKGFLDDLAGLQIKAGAAEYNLSSIKEIFADYQQAAHPEKAFLNEFENSFEEWVRETLSKNNEKERMVIFIDDLDRCMPDIALQVLEALKLYLKIDRLVFVIGMDKQILTRAVTAYYEKNNIKNVNPDDYLAKMFQTEVTVEPSEKQILDYIDWHLERVEYFKGTKYLKQNEKALFKRLITNYAKRNPREVKRLINSAIMSGAGAEIVAKAGLEETKYSFKQGVQVFFIRRILDQKYKDSLPQRFFGSNTANDFFGQWSKIVTENKEIERTVKIFYHEPEKPTKEIEPGFRTEKITRVPLKPKIDLPETINQAPKPYRKLLEDRQFTSCIHLLEDSDLGDLMQIKYSEELAEKSRAAQEEPPASDNDQIIREAIAEQLGKKPDELTKQDYDNIKELNLSGAKINDLGPVSQLKNLTELNFGITEVTNLSPISKLENLTELNFGITEVTNLSPISKLENLTKLYFFGTQVSNLAPVSQLNNLTVLSFGNTEVSDLGPVSQLKNLTELNFGGTQVSDLGPISQSKNLTELYFWRTKVSDLTPISKLENLTKLDFSCTQVSDLAPVSKLNNLTKLGFGETQVSDLGPISKLENLTILDIRDCKNIDKNQIKRLQEALPQLKIHS